MTSSSDEIELPLKQTAAWIEEPGPTGRVVIREDVSIDSPGEGDILVQLECSGIW